MKATDHQASSPADPIRVRCVPTYGDDGAPAVSITIENTSDIPVHLFDSVRLPYLLEDGDELLILYGVNPPDPKISYFLIEIPTTKVLPPGDRVEDEVGLTPLHLGDHYSLPRERNAAVARRGVVTVRCTVGWGETPILPAPEERHVRNIQELLAWQQLSRSAPVQVQLPGPTSLSGT